MEEKRLMKGNEALAEAAVRAGCVAYFGYPITPQNEVPAYMAKRMPELNRTFVQAESELAAISMVFGAGATGNRVMTSSSSPGISLMQEGLSYIAGAEVPAVIVNIMRGGPGLGNIAPSQADYLQSVKGGGHGDYQLIVLSPHTVQELVDITFLAFDLAMQYRNPVMILGDGIIGQMSEPVLLPPMRSSKEIQDEKEWAVCQQKEQKIVRSLYLVPENQLEIHNLHLQNKYQKISKDVRLFEEYETDNADYIFVAYGAVARICKSAIPQLRKKGIAIGLFRPISLWPFPSIELEKFCKTLDKIFVAEMACNQLQQDVELTARGNCDIHGLQKLGGQIFDEEYLINQVEKIIKEQ